MCLEAKNEMDEENVMDASDEKGDKEVNKVERSNEKGSGVL